MFFLPDINKHLKMFADAWNNHSIRTQNERTPRNIWLSGILENMNSNYSGVQEIFRHGPDLVTRLTQAPAARDLHVSEIKIGM